MYHRASQDSVASVMRQGLRYGAQGAASRESFAQKTNRLLDQHRTQKLITAGISRQDCLYGYLVLGGKISDIETGHPLWPTEWNPSEDQMGLILDINPETAYVGDLELYDHIAKVIEEQQSPSKLEKLAQKYWNTILWLPDALRYYRLAERGIEIGPASPAHLPRHLSRVEVLLASDIHPNQIRQL